MRSSIGYLAKFNATMTQSFFVFVLDEMERSFQDAKYSKFMIFLMVSYLLAPFSI